MTTVGIVSPGYMGAGLGWALREGGARVVATVRGRSERTRRLAEGAGLELLPGLFDVLAVADVVLSVTPPGQALAAAQTIANVARESGATPVVADLNAVSPETMAEVAKALAGLPIVDGSISGPPPSASPGARLYLSGVKAADVAALPWAGKVEPIVLGAGVGTASALKMCTASVYKGLNALVTQAMRTAGRHGVLDQVLADLKRNGLDGSAGVARSATKAHRYVDEMREIAATQAGAGLTPALFEAFAEVYAEVALTALAEGDPESTGTPEPAEIVARLGRRHGRGSPTASTRAV
jgi:3-hydroxyisobutyrate dehydrogenase-like beta-hydroxyacid dehydrogenase